MCAFAQFVLVWVEFARVELFCSRRLGLLRFASWSYKEKLLKYQLRLVSVTVPTHGCQDFSSRPSGTDSHVHVRSQIDADWQFHGLRRIFAWTCTWALATEAQAIVQEKSTTSKAFCQILQHCRRYSPLWPRRNSTYSDLPTCFSSFRQAMLTGDALLKEAWSRIVVRISSKAAPYTEENDAKLGANRIGC